MRLPISLAIARVIGGVLFLSIFCALEWGLHMQRREHDTQARLQALMYASQLRAGVDSELNSLLNITASLAGYLEVTGGAAGDETIRALLANLYSKSRHVRNFGLAIGYRLTYVYPLRGNESAIGLYYPDVPDQWPAIQRAIESGSGMLAGPVPLVQGGSGLIYRVPVNINGRYWGLLSTVIDNAELFQSVRLSDESQPIDWAVRGSDGLGKRGAVFWGKPELFNDDATVVLTGTVPGGQWVYAVRPHLDSVFSPNRLLQHALAFFAALLVGTFGYRFQLHRLELSRISTLDSLTMLPNRRAFQERLEQTLTQRRKRDPAEFALLFLDLDRFKRINDTFGHKAGDQVLLVTAGRLRDMLRAEDTIGRWGGDELVVLVRIASEEYLVQLIQRIRETIRLPILVDKVLLDVGVAIGVARFPQDGATVDELLQVADKRMYQDKQLNLLQLGSILR